MCVCIMYDLYAREALWYSMMHIREICTHVHIEYVRLKMHPHAYRI